MTDKTTYDLGKALSFFNGGGDVYVCHPNDPDDKMLSEESIKDADGHMFLLVSNIIKPKLIKCKCNDGWVRVPDGNGCVAHDLCFDCKGEGFTTSREMKGNCYV